MAAGLAAHCDCGQTGARHHCMRSPVVGPTRHAKSFSAQGSGSVQTGVLSGPLQVKLEGSRRGRGRASVRERRAVDAGISVEAGEER